MYNEMSRQGEEEKGGQGERRAAASSEIGVSAGSRAGGVPSQGPVPDTTPPLQKARSLER